MGKLSMELYLDNIVRKYKTANRRQKGEILEELCIVSGYHKKHAIRLLNQSKKCLHRGKSKDKETRGRPDKYPPNLYLEPLKRIWLSTDQLCGKRLKMALPLWLPHYSTSYEQLDAVIYQGLLKINAATIDRMLAGCRVKCKRGLSGTKPGKILKKHIPIKTDGFVAKSWTLE